MSDSYLYDPPEVPDGDPEADWYDRPSPHRLYWDPNVVVGSKRAAKAPPYHRAFPDRPERSTPSARLGPTARAARAYLAALCGETWSDTCPPPRAHASTASQTLQAGAQHAAVGGASSGATTGPTARSGGQRDSLPQLPSWERSQRRVAPSVRTSCAARGEEPLRGSSERS